MRPVTLFLSLTLAANTLLADGWFQWGRVANHDGASPVTGHTLKQIVAEVVLDPFVEQKKAGVNALLVHYPVPLIDGNDVFIVVRTGQFTSLASWQTQVWNVRNMRWAGNSLDTRWTFTTDWKPVPAGGVSWEPVYHPILAADAIWAPGLGGTIDRINRFDGTRIRRFNPFGDVVDPSIYMTGPPAIDDAGNVYYTAMQFETNLWASDPRESWLVKVAADGTITKATIRSLTPNAPLADAQCTGTFNQQVHPLPWPPSPDAVAPSGRCGVQRPGINITPAIAPDGTVYTVTRAHGNSRWSFLIAVNPDLTSKWSASLRNRLATGCNVHIPPNGTPGGCRAGAHTGVDPLDNELGSGTVNDNGTSSPVVLPDGRVLYGAYTRYNYLQGHLMLFDAEGRFETSYGFGWDITPAVYRHGGTYSILLKENRYSTGAYCGGNATLCPSNRTLATPHDPEQYFITSLDPNLNVQWKLRNTETKSCATQPDGSITCTENHPQGFEWCVNAVAVDAKGVVYANAEDGYLYAINPNGTLRERIFLRLALGAAYTPLSIGPDGKIYTQNDGRLFVAAGLPRRRAARR
jgi:outer membrane protein assembly factor BamB